MSVLVTQKQHEAAQSAEKDRHRLTDSARADRLASGEAPGRQDNAAKYFRSREHLEFCERMSKVRP